MMSDHDHLAAMGLAPPGPIPAPNPDNFSPFRRDIYYRAQALGLHILGPQWTPGLFLVAHATMSVAELDRFADGRDQFKVVQRRQNALSLEYQTRVRGMDVNSPASNQGTDVHRRWLEGFLLNGVVPLMEREWLASRAEEAALYAVE